MPSSPCLSPAVLGRFPGGETSATLRRFAGYCDVGKVFKFTASNSAKLSNYLKLTYYILCLYAWTGLGADI